MYIIKKNTGIGMKWRSKHDRVKPAACGGRNFLCENAKESLKTIDIAVEI